MSNNPISAKTALFSGAIAVSVNGVPIFNPIKNDGITHTYIAGELDEFGGHCGLPTRSDMRSTGMLYMESPKQMVHGGGS
ncbi:MAG: hypothetical protein M3Z32_01415 [Acidobacteriota bacterium]|nr:hypothetical protein [Acidobacteriota bacterium]